MDRFCVITNIEKDKDYKTAQFLKEQLHSMGKKCVIVQNVLVEDNGMHRFTNPKDIPDDIECAIVLGGDGTMIQAANDLASRDIPILGINLGTLGYLTEIEKHNIIPSLDQLQQNKYKIESRLMLKGTVYHGDSDIFEGYSLNDFVVGKRDSGRLIRVEVFINDEFLDTYVADGIIISTPTGSTGYNLSAGGPVLAPEMRAIIITPICPHSLNKRSLVVSAQDRLMIKVGQSKEMYHDEAAVIADGRVVRKITTGDRMEISMAKEDTKIIKMQETSFYERLRSKLS